MEGGNSSPMEFPTFDLNGKIALVTGSARGIGRAISLAMAHAGADVALGLRDSNAHGDLPREIAALGRQALPLQMDMAYPDQVRDAIEEARRTSGASTFWLTTPVLGQKIPLRTSANKILM